MARTATWHLRRVHIPPPVVPEKVNRHSGPLTPLQCLKAAMRDPQQARQPELRKEYSRLFTAASKSSQACPPGCLRVPDGCICAAAECRYLLQIFSAREREQLDVYGLLAVLRNQLDTDDSFELNRVLARIKQGVAELPLADEEDEAALATMAPAQVCLLKSQELATLCACAAHVSASV